MSVKVLRILPLLALLAACSREAEVARVDLLEGVPADTPYVFVTSRQLPDGLRERLADHYARQLSGQRDGLVRLRTRIAAAEETAPMVEKGRQLFDVLDALFAELEGRQTAADLRELGIEPGGRSVFYGLGVLPAMRMEIADAVKLNALLDRVESRAGASAARNEHNGQSYRRIDLGEIDAVLAVTERHAIAGLLADARFDRDLPLLLGQQAPEKSLAESGDIETLIERHRFTGFGEGFIKLEQLFDDLLGRGQGRDAEVIQALGAKPLPVSDGCMRMVERLVAGMPRIVVGISEAGGKRLTTRAVWESSPAVAAHLQRLAAPVPGVGRPYGGLMAIGMGLELPQLRNAIDALLHELIAAGSACEWVDPGALEAVIPQLNLALGPMTAGIKGFNLQIEDLAIDPDSLQPTSVRAGLLAAVDDPRGVFALGAMFNPALASLQIPDDGSFVDLPAGLGVDDDAAPPLKVAVRDKALLLLAGADATDLAATLAGTGVVSPAPILAVDYGVHRLVQRLGEVMERTSSQLSDQGEEELAQEVRDQLRAFRMQAELFDRLRVLLYASSEGLVVDQVMELR